MGGFVKGTRSLHPAEGTASLTVEEVWGGDEGPPVGWGGGTQPRKSPCQLNLGPREELCAFRSPAGGESGWVATGWQIVSMGEFILGSPTLDSLPKSGIWSLGCSVFSMEGGI